MKQVDAAIELWSKMQVADAEKLAKISANVEFQKSLCSDIVASLIQHVLLLIRSHGQRSCALLLRYNCAARARCGFATCPGM